MHAKLNFNHAERMEVSRNNAERYLNIMQGSTLYYDTPEEVIGVESTKAFKRKLDRYWRKDSFLHN